MKTLIASILLLSVLACTEKQPDPQRVLHDKVIEIHDEAMVAMGPIYQRIKSIRYLKDSTVIEPQEQARQLIKNLVDSEEAMMEWMAEWETPNLDSTSEATMNYLKTEELKIIKIHEDILHSIAEADSFIVKFNHTESI